MSRLEKRRRWLHRWLFFLVKEYEYGSGDSVPGYKGWLRFPLFDYLVAFRCDDGSLQYNW